MKGKEGLGEEKEGLGKGENEIGKRARKDVKEPDGREKLLSKIMELENGGKNYEEEILLV